MGASGSKPDRVIQELQDDEHYFGLENFGNTCYCNSVLQTLYFCRPFREQVLLYAARLQAAAVATKQPPPENMLTCLAELFVQVNSQKKKCGFVSPRRFVSRVKLENVLFSSYMHQAGRHAGVSHPASQFWGSWPSGGDRQKRGAMTAVSSARKTLSSNSSRSIFERPSRCCYPAARTRVQQPAQPVTLQTRPPHTVINQNHYCPVQPPTSTRARAPPRAAQQDAHEFLNWLLNDISEVLEKEERAAQSAARRASRDASRVSSRASSRAQSPTKVRSPTKQHGGGGPGRSPSLQLLSAAAAKAAAARNRPVRTWVHDLFQGKLVNETRCLQCETVTSREEDFYDLSLEIDQNCSLSSCLRNFSSTETLDADDKFFCDKCGCLQEAQKRMRLAQLPPVLCLHLKRFKYIESMGRMKKLMHRVTFPWELKMINTTDDCPDADSTYELFAVVVHMGAHPNHGHYVALVRTPSGQWVCFDDEQVNAVTESQVQSVFGHTQDWHPMREDQQGPHADHGYILFYQRVGQQQQQQRRLAAAQQPQL